MDDRWGNGRQYSSREDSHDRAPQRVPYNPGDYGQGRSSGVHAPRHGYDGQGSDYGQPPLYAYDAPQSRPGGFSSDRHGYPDQRSHPPPPPPSHFRHSSHRSTSPEGSRHSADHDPRDARGRYAYLDRPMPNGGDVPPNYRDSRPNPRDRPNDHPRQLYNPPHDGNHADAYQTGRQLDQLSISTSQAPKRHDDASQHSGTPKWAEVDEPMDFSQPLFGNAALTQQDQRRARLEDGDQPGSARGYPDQPGSGRGYTRDAGHPDPRRRDYNPRFNPQRSSHSNHFNPRDEPHWRSNSRGAPPSLEPHESEPREGSRRGEGLSPSDPQDIPPSRGLPRQPDGFHSGSLGTDTDRSVHEGLSRSPGNLSPGEHARGPTKILKRDPSSEAASPHDYAAPSVPPSSSQAAPASRPLQGHPEGGRGADEPPRADPISAAGGANNRGMLPPSFSAAGQTPAGAAAAAAAHAAMAGPLNPPRPPAPKYNPPSHLPDQPPPQRHDKPPQQQQGVSSIDALASVGSHHSLKLSSSQQSLNQAQQRPQGGSGAAALSQADPSLPYPQGGGGPRPQMPVPEPRPLPQNELGGMGPHPTPSQQITAQAARHEPQRVQQNQAVGNGTQPSNTMQFGSMLHVPSQAKMDGSQSTPNPLQFGIPAGMLPGAGAEGRAQPVPAQGPPGGSRGPGQNAQPGRHTSTEGPWQPEDAEAQREFMRQRVVQRAQAQQQMGPRPSGFSTPSQGQAPPPQPKGPSKASPFPQFVLQGQPQQAGQSQGPARPPGQLQPPHQEAPQRPPVLAQVSWEKPSDSQPSSAPPQPPMQPPVGSQQLPKDPWATPDPQDKPTGPTTRQPSTWVGPQALSGLQQSWQGQSGSQHAQRGPQHAQRSQNQGPPSWQGPARRPYTPHLVGQEGFVAQHAQQAGPRLSQQQQEQAPQRQRPTPPVQPAPGLQPPPQGEPASGQGHADRQAGQNERQQGQDQRPNRRSPPQSQQAYQGQQGQQPQDQALPESLPGPLNLPQQQRSGQGARRQVVPINNSSGQGQRQGGSQQPQDPGLPPPPARGPQRPGQRQGQGGSQEALPPPPPRSDGTNASRPGSGKQQGQGSSEQTQPGALKEENSGDVPHRERRGKGRDRSSRDRGGREEPPSTGAGAGEAPPAPGLTRGASRQEEQQEQQGLSRQELPPPPPRGPTDGPIRPPPALPLPQGAPPSDQADSGVLATATNRPGLQEQLPHQPDQEGQKPSSRPNDRRNQRRQQQQQHQQSQTAQEQADGADPSASGDAATAEGGRPGGPRSKGPQQRRRLPKAARDQQQAAAGGGGLSAESSSASLPTDGPAAQQRRAPPGLAIGNAPRETANGKGSAPPPALTPPSTDLAQPQPQQGEGREDKDGKTARKQLPDRAIYQPPAGPPDSAAEGETSASGEQGGRGGGSQRRDKRGRGRGGRGRGSAAAADTAADAQPAGEAGEPSSSSALGRGNAAAALRSRGRGRGGRGNNRSRGSGGAQRNPPALSTAAVAPKDGINPLPANAGQGWD
ncbi:hypothetical protein ABBQ32_008051 [Trebouxia sp. C0010 RCD-2024]